MTQHLGKLLMAFAVIHVAVSFMVFGSGLQDISSAPLASGLSWSFEMLNAYWFLIFAWPLFLLGFVVNSVYKATGSLPAPRVLGWGLILVPVISVLYLPVSGLWLFIAAGILSLGATRAAKA